MGTVELPNKKYSIIYADPPWNFKTYSKKGQTRSASNYYTITILEELKKIPVETITNDNCILFMWATYPNLKDAFELIEVWKFEYKTVAFTWVKSNKHSLGFFIGMGYWTRANPEICLLATKGSPKRVNKNVQNLVISKIREHSRKPDIIAEKIVKLCGDIPRIELFARTKRQGWDSLGNEILWEQ